MVELQCKNLRSFWENGVRGTRDTQNVMCKLMISKQRIFVVVFAGIMFVFLDESCGGGLHGREGDRRLLKNKAIFNCFASFCVSFYTLYGPVVASASVINLRHL